MNNINYYLLLALVLIITYLIFHFLKNRKRKYYKKLINESWGKVKEEDYYNFDAIAKYFNRNKKDDCFHVLSEREVEDLDLLEVFKYLNRTCSKIGEQYLYYKLRCIPSRENNQAFLENQNHFRNIDENKALQLELIKLSHPKIYRLEELIQGELISKPAYSSIIILTTLTVIASLVMSPFYPIFLLLLIPCYLVNLFFHYSNKNHVNFYTDGFSQLFQVYQVAKKLKSFKSVQNLKLSTRFLSTLRKIKFKAKFLDDGQLMNNEFGFGLWIILEQFKILFNYESLIFFSVIKDLRTQRQDLHDLFHFIGTIDIHVSIASLKDSDLDICTPNFQNSKQLKVQDIYHPLIPNCVQNDLSLNHESLLLTGSNMSGKTTFIRTLALNLILGQTLNICFAKNFQTPYSKVYTAIRLSDDLLSSTSYFMEEVKQIKKFIKASEETTPCLFVLDEIFKGTNTDERIASAYGVLKYINSKEHLVLVSTHDKELTHMLEKFNYGLYFFTENILSKNLNYDYKIKAGQLQNGNAIKLLELNNFPSELILDAKSKLV